MSKGRKHGKWASRTQKRRNDELRPGAKKCGEPYTCADDNAIINPFITDRDLAKALKRSLYAIRARRKRLRKV